MEKNRKALQLILGIAVAMFIAMTTLQAQNTEGFIYGKVYTSDNTYKGQLRWGKEEAYWNDHFNAAKVENQYAKFKRKKSSSDSWRDLDWRISSIWDDKSSGTVHQFSCQFGDMKTLQNNGNERMTVVLKNGEEIRLSGSGYNDGSSRIVVLDDELGIVNLSWNRVRKVEFMETPKNLSRIMGAPLYGTVETHRKGNFTGYVQWDHDERIGTDKLDGDTRDGDVSITFDKIQKIERGGNGSQIVLYSGREFYLTGSNDVNNGNRGIIVSVDNVGKIDIPWSSFKAVTYEKAKASGSSYASYTMPKGLSGKVYTYDDEQIDGQIIFDLDEAYELEILEAKDDDVEYKIPFRNIKSIRPKNYNYSMVVLRNGNELLLGDARDVSDRNAGLLVYTKGGNEPVYIEWKNVTEIVFD
ncbi:hypothetical protein [Fulvivirga lutimaris]|uniref:hypothetical protein n=1 Tax=Fulvivirga lutimaris TaxID=1819566 RepID=UPI0012BB4E06|nr:hypothetical protein [Fulvivirga lutimaris]MTI41011.1 hypothetical protein [Fulvivirga lutimaris]